MSGSLNHYAVDTEATLGLSWLVMSQWMIIQNEFRERNVSTMSKEYFNSFSPSIVLKAR
jgi:hypothetical protein